MWLQAPTIFWLSGETISPIYRMYRRLRCSADWNTDSRTSSTWAQYLWSWDGYWRAKKDTHHQVLIKSQQKWLKQEGRQFDLRPTHIGLWISELTLLERVRTAWADKGVNHCVYLWIRRVIKQTVVVIEAYQFCWVHTKFFPTSCCQG